MTSITFVFVPKRVLFSRKDFSSLALIRRNAKMTSILNRLTTVVATRLSDKVWFP